MKIGEVWIDKNEIRRVVVSDIIDIYKDNKKINEEITFFYIDDTEELNSNTVSKNTFMNEFEKVNNEKMSQKISALFKEYNR